MTPSVVFVLTASASQFVPPSVALAWGFVFWIGFSRFGSRWFEYDCDRRAAWLCGSRAMASALAKVHAVSGLRQQGWLARLIYETATHPSLSQRIAALDAMAPDDDRPEPLNDIASEVSVCRLSLVLTFAWAGVLGMSLEGAWRCWSARSLREPAPSDWIRRRSPWSDAAAA